MGKHGGTNKKTLGDKSGESNLRQSKTSESSPRAYDKDTAIFISMSQELKNDGNRLFQKRDYEGAMLKYEKALKLLPRNHVDVSYLRSNMAACYMQLGISEYPRAIHECNLALEVTPKYSKALLKRARCYEALNKLDLALRDVGTVLKMEQNNIMATEIAERVKNTLERQGSRASEIPIDLIPLPEYVEPPPPSAPIKASKEKTKKNKSNNFEGKIVDDTLKKTKDGKGCDKQEMKGKDEEENIDDVVMTGKSDRIDEKKSEDKLVVEEEKSRNGVGELPRRTVKLVFGEEVRWAQIPVNCNMLKLREAISDRFPSSEAVHVKYRDEEGDLVTIATTEELRWAEAASGHGSVKLYIVEVNPDQSPSSQKVKRVETEAHVDRKDGTENGHMGRRKELQSESSCISDWIIEFAQFFKNYAGFDIDAYLNLHEVGIKLYSEAMEEAITSEEAQDLFSSAADTFQELAALALFNWGNVHMSRARKKVYFTEDSSRESVLMQIKSTYDWAQKEYMEAGKKYEEALKIKSNFYEAILACGQLQFEQAKLSWYFAVGTNIDLESWPSTEVLQLYNNAEENIEKGMIMWEDAEERRLNELSKPKKAETLLQKMKLDNLFEHISANEASEQASNVQSQIFVLWGTMLYERSIMEFKLGLPVWQECLEVAVEKFELAGASPSDIAVMIKNHCSIDTASKGLGFNIDEIVQAWNEMYEAKRWQSSIPCFRLEPLLRRRASTLCYALEHA